MTIRQTTTTEVTIDLDKVPTDHPLRAALEALKTGDGTTITYTDLPGPRRLRITITHPTGDPDLDAFLELLTPLAWTGGR